MKKKLWLLTKHDMYVVPDLQVSFVKKVKTKIGFLRKQFFRIYPSIHYITLYYFSFMFSILRFIPYIRTFTYTRIYLKKKPLSLLNGGSTSYTWLRFCVYVYVCAYNFSFFPNHITVMDLYVIGTHNELESSVRKSNSRRRRKRLRMLVVQCDFFVSSL